MTVRKLGSKAVARHKAKRTGGMDRETSTKRMIAESTRPPKYPEITPRVIPIDPAMPIPITEMVMETREP